jgi:hypothetical protein
MVFLFIVIMAAALVGRRESQAYIILAPRHRHAETNDNTSLPDVAVGVL